MGLIGLRKTYKQHLLPVSPGGKPLGSAVCQEPDKLRSLGIIGKSADKSALHAE